MERHASFDARAVEGPVQTASNWIYFVGDPLPGSLADTRQKIGSKALSLARLSEAGFDTPPAFTICSDVYRNFLARGSELPNEVWDAVHAAMARLESVTGRQFATGPQPLTVAVRSGAAESMPGILATVLHCGLSERVAEAIGEQALQAFAEFLDCYAPLCLGSVVSTHVANEVATLPPAVRCQRWLTTWKESPCGPLPDDPEAIFRATVAAVFKSWNSAEARHYRGLHGFDPSNVPSVTVQEMFVADIAGVVFSRNPSQPEASELIVEAIAGSGRDLVGGKATPMRWTVDRHSLTTQCINVGGAMTCAGFAERWLPRLCREVLAIEALFDEPVDVEFGCAHDRLVYFQARPLKKDSLAAKIELARNNERARLSDWAVRGKRFWVRHNLAETLPSPTPLTWDLWRGFMTGRGGLGGIYRRLGYRPSRRVGKEGFVELVAGRIYADPQRLTEMLCAGYPFTFDRDALRHDPAVLSEAPSGLDLEQLDPWFLLRWPWVMLTFARATLCRRRLSKSAAERFDREVLPRVRSFVDTERRVELTRLSLQELVGVFHRRRHAIFDDLAVECFLPGMLGVAAWDLLCQRLGRVVERPECRTLCDEILAVIGTSIPVEQQAFLARLDCGELSVDAFLHDFGHRGPGEMDLSSPRWRETPEALVAWSAQRTRTSMPAAAMGQLRPLDQARDVLRGAVGDRAAKLDTILRQAVELLPYREIGKHEFLRTYDLLRDVLREMAHRTDLGEGIHFLKLTEFDDLPFDRDLRSTVATRREHHLACMRLYVPAVLELDDLQVFGRPAHCDTGRSIAAMPLSRGVAAGRVLLFSDGRRPTEAVSERVVVAQTIEPAWMPLMADVAALIVEQGGVLSHVALLARQLAIPMVVVEGITSQLMDGEMIVVDADRGFVERQVPSLTTDD